MGDNTIRVFVGQVPKSVTDQEFADALRDTPGMVRASVLTDRNTSESKGCGFLHFHSIDDAIKACEKWNDRNVFPNSDRPLRVQLGDRDAERYGVGKNAPAGEVKLHCGGLPFENWSESQTRALFEPFGEVVEVFHLKRRDNPSQFSGAAFVKMANGNQAQAAIRALDQTTGKVEGGTRPLGVRLASQGKPQGSGGNVHRLDGPGGDRGGPGYGGPAPGYGAPGYGTPPQYGAPAYGAPAPGYGAPPQYGGPAYGAPGYGAPAPAYGYPPHGAAPYPVPAQPYPAPRAVGPWKEYRDPHGKPYYHNAHTGETTWTMPPEMAQPAPAPAPQNPPQNRSAGPWVEYFDQSTGKPYYHNRETNMTTWDRPAEFASGRYAPY
mmetsp:Transcript_53582/g.142439  ORF Transcript_53582/g.142439 Transcript_53582/m.142439 type:complete len:378 (-) Transcript_53582:495-1628(-)